MPLRVKIVIAIMTSVIVSALMAATPLFIGARQIASEGAERRLAQTQAQIEASLDNQFRIALSMAEMIAAIPRVKRAVEKGDTRGLYRLFVKDFESLSASTGIAQFQFHTPQAISILRVHDPDKNGDDLSSFRHMVVAANQASIALSGLERGGDGLGIRGIAPVVDDGEHLGTVEFGLRFDSALLAQIMQGGESGLEVYLLPNGDIDHLANEDSQIIRLSTGYDGDALLTKEDVRASLTSEGIRRDLIIGGEQFGTHSFIIEDYSGAPVALANIVMSLKGTQQISHSVMIRTMAGLGGAFVICLVLAWIFGRNLTGKLQQLIGRMKQLAEGETRLNLTEMQGEKAEIGQIIEHMRVFRDGMYEASQLKVEQDRAREAQTAVVGALAQGLNKLAAGNLKAQITGSFDPAYEALIRDYNGAVSRLQEVISQISASARAVTASADEIASSAENLSERTESSAATLEETAAALGQITGTVKDSTEGARAADQSGQDAIQKARSGAQIVSGTVQAMGEIDQSAGEIARISGLIDDIAFQTNLLALNAGVEAARAGSAGSGFAVVAAEVRSLAQRTTEAARQIGSLIATSGERVQQGVSLVGETGDSLNTIVGAVETVTSQIRKIAELAAEQEQGLEEINTAITLLDRNVQENAGMFTQTSAASALLQKEGARLAQLVGQFQLPSTDDQTNKRTAA